MKRTELVACLLVILLYAIFVTNGTLDFEFSANWRVSYYAALAEGFLRGHVHLPYEPSPRLLALADPYSPELRAGVPYRWDLSFFEGRYYLYFSPLPALLCDLPIRIITGVYPGYNWSLFTFTTLSFLASVIAFKKMLAKAPRQALPHSLYILVLGLGNFTPYFLNLSTVYAVAIASAMFFMSLSFICLFNLLSAQRANVGTVFLFGLVLGMACLSRPNLICLYAVLPALVWVSVKQNFTTFRLWLWGFLGASFLIWIPALAYNYTRFNSIKEFGLNYQLTHADHRRVKLFDFTSPESLSRVSSNLNAYLFHAPKITLYPPFIELKRTSGVLVTLASGTRNRISTKRIGGAWILFPYILWSMLLHLVLFRELRHKDFRFWVAVNSGYIAGGLILLVLCFFLASLARYQQDFLQIWIIVAVCVTEKFLILKFDSILARRISLVLLLASVIVGGVLGFSFASR